MSTAIVLGLIKTFFAGFVKDFLFKTLLGIVQDSFAAIFSKIAWKVVIERFLTRMTVLTLRWVKGLTSNTLVDSTVDDILAQLRASGLAAANTELKAVTMDRKQEK